MLAVQRVRHDQAEHGVAEELQPLIGGQAAVLVRVGPVRQRTLEQVMGNRDVEGGQQLRPVALAAADRRSIPCGHGSLLPRVRNQWIRVG